MLLDSNLRRALAAILLPSAIVLSASAAAEPLRLDHEQVTVEPIEASTFDDRTAPDAGGREEAPSEAFWPSATEASDPQSPAAVDLGPELAEPNPPPAAEQPQSVGAEPAEMPPAFEPQPTMSEAAPLQGPETDPAPPAFPDTAASGGHFEPAAGTASATGADNANMESDMTDSDTAKTAEPLVEADPMMEAAAAEALEAAKVKRDKNGVEVAAVAPEAKTDIYDKWVRQKFQSRRKLKTHPLANRHPEHFVVVCEAGCSKEFAHIVYVERKDARGPVNAKPINRGEIAGTDTIDCVGGCYGNRNSFAAMVPADENPAFSAADPDNGWMSTVKKAAPADQKKSGANSGSRWYERIN